MLKGVEYAHSSQKRGLDLLIASGVSPTYLAARLFLRSSVRQAGLTPTFVQPRVGQDGEFFVLSKLRTLTDENSPIDARTESVRRHGIDELGQIKNIFTGDMSVVGHRPIVAKEFEEFMDNVDPILGQRWTNIVKPTRPGIVSSHGIGFHIGFGPEVDQFNMRAENDTRDVLDGSLTRDLALLKKLAHAAAHNLF